jgi:hypothetical protein
LNDLDIDDLLRFLRPLYQDLDGITRLDAVERIGRIARRLAPPSRELQLLLLFHPLGSWLGKVGNRSRVALATSVSEAELHQIAASIGRLDAPESEAERAVAAAILIDGAGMRGFAERLGRARREGSSIDDVAREALMEMSTPKWLTGLGAEWLAKRCATRKQAAIMLVRETALEDLG